MIGGSLVTVIQELVSPVILSKSMVSDEEYSFELKGKKNNWNINLWFPSNFPYVLPKAILLNTEFIGSIPHVEKSGVICVEESDSVLTDYKRPSDIIEHFLLEALDLLERAKLKIYQDELLNEYEGYFSSCNSVNSFYKASDHVEDVSLKIMYRENNRHKKFPVPILLFGKDNTLPNQFSNIGKTNDIQVINVIHLPLLEAALPPPYGEDISASYINNIQQQLDEKQKRRLTKRLKKEKPKNQFFVLLSMPRSNDERTQLLLQFTAEKAFPHPLSLLTEDWKVTPFLLTRHNQEYLLERGGAEHSLLDKKVAVIGCGSVGSEVAVMLAKAGIGELSLVDHDFLEADNIYRHRLGGVSLNYLPIAKTGEVPKRHKVYALASLLTSELPYIRVNPKPTKFESILNDKNILDADIIVIAVGSPSINLCINKQLRELGLKKVVFCWNEASNYGGHAVALDLAISCLECTYTSDKGFELESELSLLQPSQSISKNLTGCAGVFTPFSYLDSSQTAAMAAKLSLGLLQHNQHSKALSWKGDDFGKLKVTDRYMSMPLKEELTLCRKEKCRVCND